MSKRSVNPQARRRARRTLLQALYAWQMTAAELGELGNHFASSDEMRKGDTEYFLACLQGVVNGVAGLDPLFAPYLDRTIAQLDGVERAILRAGAYELRDRIDVPVRVVIDEWVELAKGFGATESFRYVNGVLDRVARDVRKAEFADR
ncbi:MAG: transcription antitermination factor NusB [Gammaproteobacteria bacterium]|nr:transcription antitermination factor NusB [Gammaproteobacteria bacterium]